MKYGMKSRVPATVWQDALPLGNGKTGALIFGNIHRDTVVLNHEELFFKCEKPEILDVSDNFSKFKEMVKNGNFSGGNDFFKEKIIENIHGELKIDPYQPMYLINIMMPPKSAFSDYERSLNFENGLAKVCWNDNGIIFEKSYFVSIVDNIFVTRITADKKKSVTATLSVKPQDITKKGATFGNSVIKDGKLPFDYEILYEKESISFNAKYRENEIIFGGKTRIFTDSNDITTDEKGGVTVNDADEIIFITKIYINEEKEKVDSALNFNENIIFETMFGKHETLFSELFNRVVLDIPSKMPSEVVKTNEELVFENYNGKINDELLLKMYHFGRYLLISSSFKSKLPANLQGLWNGDYDPEWQADFHNDENIQMNYWAALSGNLKETTTAYFDYYNSMMEDFKTNAKNIYGCRGIMAPVAQSTHGYITYPDLPWFSWTAGAGWLGQLYFDYWLYTGDDDFLKTTALPYLEEVAYFYEDFVSYNDEGNIEFIPSLSPENVPIVDGEPSNIFCTINATMDIAVCKEVLLNLITAYKHLDIGTDKIILWENMINRLPKYELNEDGAFREWIYPKLEDNYNHRHQCHIYPLFPGIEITKENDEQMFEGLRVAIEKRLTIGLTSQTGWSYAHMANVYARLGDGERLRECLSLICRSCLGQNLFTYHNDWREQGLTLENWFGTGEMPPFQIDANFGITAAVTEALLFSNAGFLKLCPALPDSWENGKIVGLQARGAITVNIEWDLENNFLSSELTSKTDQKITLKLPKWAKLSRSHKEIYFKNGDKYVTVLLKANEKFILN